MDESVQRIEDAIKAVDRLSSMLAKKRIALVRSEDERQSLKANAFAWFKSHKPVLEQSIEIQALSEVDRLYKYLLACADRAATRTLLRKNLKLLKSELVKVRSQVIATPEKHKSLGKPDFSGLIASPQMRTILERRWAEARACLDCGACLAATVMMGALLEALFLARVNSMEDKKPLFKLTSAPKDKQTKKAKPLNEWTLKDYIETAYELGWIRDPARKVIVVIRDYRNFIHPERELSSGFNIEAVDAKMFWAIFVELSEQLIVGASKKI